MSTFRNPVGPQPSRVYWRRRLAVLAGVCVVILIIVLIVFAPKGKPAAIPSNSPKPTTAATQPCTDKAVEVDAVVDKLSYAAGEDPQLSFTLQNGGTKACTFQVGTNVQKFVITSGSETIWTSTDCQTDSSAKSINLQPGTPVQSPKLTWARDRSSTTTCSVKNPKQVTAGGASYHLTVTVNSVTSTAANSPQFVLR